jgi:hypothetical protein
LRGNQLPHVAVADQGVEIFRDETMTDMKPQWWSGAEIPSHVRPIQAIVPRQGGEKTVAVVRALVSPEFGSDEDRPNGSVMLLQGRIYQAVSDWLRETETGRQYVESTHFHFSVGDLAELIDAEMDAAAEYGPQELESFLRRWNILALHVEIYRSDEAEHTWGFDDKLFDDLEIDAGYYAEQDRRDAKRCTD